MQRMASKKERLLVLRNLRRNHSASTIQARVRGVLVRKRMKQGSMKDATQLINEDDDGDDDNDSDAQEEEVMSQYAIKEELESTDAIKATGVHPPWPHVLLEDFASKDWPKLDDESHIEEWILEHKKIAVRYITWNLCAKKPPTHDVVEKTLIPRERFHIIVIGTEECERSIAQSALNSSKRNWESYLNALLGDTYVPIKSHTLQAIHCILFAHRIVAHLITEVKSAAVPCGVGNTLGNKGGVGIFFKVGRTSCVVVNAHLAAHQNAVKQRNDDCNKICKEIPILLRKKKIVAMVPQAPRRRKMRMEVLNESKILDESEAKLDTDSKELNENFEQRGVATAETANMANNTSITLTKPAPLASITSAALSINVALPESNAVPNVKPSVSPSISAARHATELGPPASVSGAEILIQRSKASSKGTVGLEDCADRVVFMGDLNYRIRGNRAAVDMLLAKEMHEVLRSNDQLTWSLEKHLILENFVEPPLNFKPTYKLDLNLDTYDTGSKKRIPAWTDRILYSGQGMHCVAYNADFTLKTSDHRPVYATFLIDIDVDAHLMHGSASVDKLIPRFSNESQVCGIS